MDMLVEIFTTSLTPIVFLYMFVGVVAGICIGALPGLTATMGVALLLPMTFGMDAAQETALSQQVRYSHTLMI